MTFNAIRDAQPDTTRRPARWLPLLIVSALLHVVAIGWIADAFNTLIPPAKMETSEFITATLEPPARPVIAAATTAKPIRPKKIPAPRMPRVVTPEPQQPVTQAMAASQPSTPADDSPAEIQPGEGIAITDAASPEPDKYDKSDNAAILYKVDLPPSAELKYDIQKTPTEGAAMYGSGTIKWHTDGGQYRVDGDFGVLFITALRFQSAGTIEDIGIVPELYSEKRFRKPETNTHFHRERDTISFSSSTQIYPRTGGEQDRASIIWQLAGIGRGDAGKFFPGAAIDLFVAGTRTAETWRIRIIALEEISVAGVTTSAWHLARAPKSGSHDQKLDIWLAPGQNWYPVRLRYTESNGDTLDMSMTGLNVSAVP